MDTRIRLSNFGAARGREWRAMVLSTLALAILVGPLAPCHGGTFSNWAKYLIAASDWHASIAGIGVYPGAHEGYDGFPLVVPPPSSAAIYVLLHRQTGPGWTGPTGFYASDPEPPIPTGGSHTWWDIYAWAQNYTPDPPDRFVLAIDSSPDRYPPAGFTGHLVLDQVPESANWTGPMDYWLDLSVRSEITLPLAIVTDPLQGTRTHLTVYAPIPEPSSLAGLGFALAGVGIRVARWRR